MTQSDIHLSDIMIKMDAMYNNQQELKGEIEKIRQVVIGNGDSSSILHQVRELKFIADIALKDRERMSGQVERLQSCVANLEREGISEVTRIEKISGNQLDIINRLDTIEIEQKNQGELIQAFRNRVIGIVAVLSLLAGAGAGFVAAARLLEAAVP